MIHLKRNQRVAHLIIDQPPVNVLDAALLAELVTTIESCRRDGGLSAVVLSGEGRCFSAGASVAEHKAESARGMIEGLIAACTALADLPIPAVALVHGSCLGGAMEIISFCDFVVADPGAVFGQPEIKLAFFPPVACVRLPRLAGLQNAAFSIFSGENIPAERALTMGIAQKLVDRDQWDEIEALFNGLSGASLRITKRAMREAGGEPLRDRLDAVAELFLGDLYAIEDVDEGIASFEERRKPEWRHT